MASPPSGRLSNAPARAIAAALDAHPRRVVDAPERRRAAVLLLLFERGGEPHVVLTKRTDTVRNHKGEISFPGGAKDPQDDDLWNTALRETEEELGLDAAAVERLGALDDFPTFATGYIVSTFVGSFDPSGGWRPSEHEIAEVIELPLVALARAGRMEVWEREGIRYPMHIFEVEGHRVWGVTAFILRRFLDIVAPVLGLPAPGSDEHPDRGSAMEARPR